MRNSDFRTARLLAALISGALFGIGLAMAGMTDARRIIGFLDLTGNWNPTLAFVLGGAVLTSALLFPLIKKQGHPLFDTKFRIPNRTDIDAKLLGGAALFGIGWGLAGYCPGPAIAGLGTLSTEALWFVPAMLGGSLIHSLFDKRAPNRNG